MEQQKVTAVVILDLSAAFDTVDHNQTSVAQHVLFPIPYQISRRIYCFSSRFLKFKWSFKLIFIITCLSSAKFCMFPWFVLIVAGLNLMLEESPQAFTI